MDERTSARFWARVDKNGPGGCWLWTGAMKNGYGSARVAGRTQVAHRLTWELAQGPIPEGMHIDHLCRVRACVNPDHLEPVTVAENNRRMVRDVYANATHCKRGHLWTENASIHPRGYRYCLACHRDREAERRRQLPPTACEECGGDAFKGYRFCSVSCSNRYAWAHSRRPSQASPADQDLLAAVLWDNGRGAGQWACK